MQPTPSFPPAGPRRPEQRAAGNRSHTRGNRWVVARNSPIHGRGLFAKTAIPDGTRVIRYVGERITKTESLRREQVRLKRLLRGRDASVTIFALNKRHDIDGRVRWNLARWINHACKPNCRSEIIRGQIWIIARTEIPPGQELTFDYGYPLAEWRKHPCRCGAAECPGYIVAKAQRKRLRRRLRMEKRGHLAH